MAQRLGRPAGALAASSTIALAVAVVVLAEPGRRWVGALMGLALVWGCAPLLAALMSPRPGPGGAGSPGVPGSVTTFVRLGDEPPEIARSTVALAHREGPTVIVASDREVPDDLALDADAVHVATTIEEAIRSAASGVQTDAVLLVSARAVPEMSACERAATLLDDTTGWVTGTSRPFNRDRYASDRREVIGSALRRGAAGVGTALWENDATIVRTDLLADHLLDPGRTWGTWLRDRRREGLRGAQVDDALSLRAAPVAAGAYWPDSLLRQRAAAIDLTGALSSGPRRSRVQALLLLARELYAYPLVVWLLTPVLLGDGFPFRVDPWVGVAVVTAVALARWWALRTCLGVEPVPRADLLGAVYHAPGSISALGAVIGRRIRPRRRTAPTRPLVWAALILTVVAAVGLLRHEPGQSVSRAAVGMSLVMLGALWAFTVRSLVERNWARSSYRVRLRLPASVDGVRGETVDGSPGGVAVRGRFPADDRPVGSEVEVTVSLDDGTTFAAAGVVAARRRSRGADLLGIELHPGPAALDGWSAQLLRGSEAPVTSHAPTVALERVAPRSRVVAALDRVVMVAVVLTSIAVVAALVLVLLGFRPLVVRSGSMVPTYHVGDIVFVEQVHADELRPGEVVSLAYYPEYGESLTHRVRSVQRVDGDVQVETRGDANDTSETWTVAPDAMVGRVVGRVPAVGAPATMVRTATVPLVVGLVVVALVVVAVIGGIRVRRPARGPSGGDVVDGADPGASDEPTAVRHGPG